MSLYRKARWSVTLLKRLHLRMSGRSSCLSLACLSSLPWPLLSLQLLLTSATNIWLFTSSLLIYQMMPGSLTLPAIHGVVGMVSTLLLSPYLGSWLDLTPRLQAALLLTTLQGVATASSSLVLGLALYHQPSLSSSPSSLLCVLVLVLATAVLGGLATGGINLLIQKDWLVVMYGQTPDKLARINSAFRAIDLGTRSIVPPLAGLVLSIFSYHSVAWAQTALLLLLTLGQALLFCLLYSRHLALAQDREGQDSGQQDEEGSCCSGLYQKLLHTVKGFQFFWRHPLCTAGLSLAMLYLTVLGFDSITISFCKASGVSESLVGLLFGVSSFLGFLGSVAFPLLRARLGTDMTALLGLSILVLCDALCALSVFLPSSQFMQHNSTLPGREDIPDLTSPPASAQPSSPSLAPVYLFVAAITAARFGLHLFDLCLIQLFQEGVREEKRGVFSGVETSLCYGLDMVKFVLVLLLPSPSDHFGYLILISFTSVFCGWCLFVLFLW